MVEAILIPRVIPCLLLQDDGLVKTIRFRDPTYLGDPINVINLFNRFEVDEIILLDIGASAEGRPPSLDLIEELSAECWVPLTFGGGISNLEDARAVLTRGVEKVVFGVAAADDPNLIRAASDEFGAQAVVVSVDARKTGTGSYETYVLNGSRPLGLDPVAFAEEAERHGAGEIFVNSIDRDGMMSGYDVELIRAVADAVSVPVIACGGAGERADLAIPILHGHASAVAAGSLFVYQGRERGILINFPEREYLEGILAV